MRGVSREALLGAALVLCAALTLVLPALGSLGAAAVGVIAQRSGLTRLAVLALGIWLLGLLLVLLFAL